MQSFRGAFRLLSSHNFKHLQSKLNGSELFSSVVNSSGFTESFSGSSTLFRGFASVTPSPSVAEVRCGVPAVMSVCKRYLPSTGLDFSHRSMSAVAQSDVFDYSAPATDVVPTRIKFKRLDKTAKHIMQILDREAVSEVQAHRDIPEIRPGYVIQLKMEVPENKRRVQVVKGVVIARRNAGLNTTFRLRRLVGGVGVESLFPLYSPNIREIKVLEKKKVRRAKLYYLRDKMNALKK